jgi:predicted acyl esterase
MRVCILLSAVCLVVSLAPAQAVRDTVWLVMDDSIRIDATYFTPQDSPPPGGFPSIIFVHGLGGSKSGCEPAAQIYAGYGYVTLAYSVRGQGNSTGKSMLFSWRERRDLAAVAAWLAARPNMNDTLLGVAGGSQGGYHSWYAGLDEVPGVRAAEPDNAVPHFEDDMARYGCYGTVITNLMNYSSNVRIDTLAIPVRRLMRADNYDSIRLLVADGRTFDSTDVAASSVAFLMAGAWHDHCFAHSRYPGAFNVAPPHSMMYLGAGGHGSEYVPAEVAFRDTLRRCFFGERLKGEYHGLDTIGPGIVSLGPDWQHVEFSSWPPPGLTYQDFWLHSDSSMNSSPPGGGDSLARLQHKLTNPSYSWDSAVTDLFRHATGAFLRNRASFRTAPLSQAVQLLGIPEAEVWAKGPVPMKQISLQLYDEPPAGPPTYLAQISLGKRDNADSTAWDRLAGEFSPVGWEIPAGHRIRVDWATINQTLTDTLLWRVPYWNADGTLVLGLDSLHPARISFPVLLPAGVQETPNAKVGTANTPTIVRGVLRLQDGPSTNSSWLLDAAGRKVLDLHAGTNDVSCLAPGVYFVRERLAVGGERSAVGVRKVIVSR